MELSLGNIRNIYEVIMPISNKKLPIKLSYIISKNLSVLEKEASIIDDNRIKLAQTYADKDDNGEPKTDNGVYCFSDKNKVAFTNELNDYYQTKIDIAICKAGIKELDKLEDPRYDALTPSEIAALDFMLEDDQKTEN